MKPSIIFAVTNDLSYDQRMTRICTTLAKNDFKVLLVGREKSNSIPLVKMPFQQYRLKMWFEKGKLFYLEYTIRLFWLLLRKPTHFIGSIDLDTLLPCFLIAKIRRKPIIFDAHEYFTETPEVTHRPFVKFIWQGLANFIIPRLRYAYTVSNSLQSLFSKQYGIPFDLIRNITTLSETFFSESTITLDKPALLYQGVLNEGRGLEMIIEAMSQLPNFHLYLAGEGDISDKLRKMVATLGLEDNVHFLGLVPPILLKEITRQATIGLNLLENRGLSYYYSLANKTFDYIHEGLPALHPDFPEYKKLNEEIKTGVLVKDLTVDSLVAAILALYNDADRYGQLKANCLTAKQLFNWQREEQKLIAFYQSVLLKESTI